MARNNKWKITGINLTESDAIYQNIQQAAANWELSESNLAGIAGHRGPVDVDFFTRTIDFRNF